MMVVLDNVKVGDPVLVTRNDSDSSWMYTIQKVSNDFITIARKVGDFDEPPRTFARRSGFELGNQIFRIQIPTIQQVHKVNRDQMIQSISNVVDGILYDLHNYSNLELNHLLNSLKQYKPKQTPEQQLAMLLSTLTTEEALKALRNSTKCS